MRSAVKRKSGQADVCVMAGTAAHTVFVVLFMTEIHAKTRQNGGKTIKIYEYTYMEKIYNINKVNFLLIFTENWCRILLFDVHLAAK